MPFVDFKVKEIIEEEKRNNPEFAKVWEESRNEYDLLIELVELRKEQNITQAELARLTGYRQQMISRIEKRENSPTLKTFCGLVNSLGYDLRIVKKASM